jgi:hypothetical protein
VEQNVLLILFVMEKNFVSILSSICSIKLDFNRLNDVTTSAGELTIGFYDTKDAEGKTESNLCLKDEKGVEYSLSIRQLAALRIANGEIKSEWLDEFKSDPNGVTFQSIARELMDAGKSIENVKFTVVKQLKVKNAMVTATTEPVYIDKYYEGEAEYKKGISDLFRGKPRNFYMTPEYSRGMHELRTALHSTPVRKGKNQPENVVLLPVFKIS